MLTQEQIEKLQSLMQHPRYGKLLISAIENWKIVDPVRHDYGVWFDFKKESWVDDELKCKKCLIGSAIFKSNGRNINLDTYPNGLLIDSQISKASEEFKIPYKEVCDLVTGFDLSSAVFEDNEEAYEFGKQVSMIIFNEENEC